MTPHTATGGRRPTPPFDFAKSLAFLGHFAPTRRLLEAASAIYGQGRPLAREDMERAGGAER